MTKQPVPMSFRPSVETKEALERAAQKDMRSVSSLVEKILVEWLREKGYLPK